MNWKMNKKLFASDIKAKRKLYKIGQIQCGKESGLSPSIICKVENEQSASLQTFERLCDWLHKEPSRYWRKVKRTR